MTIDKIIERDGKLIKQTFVVHRSASSATKGEGETLVLMKEEVIHVHPHDRPVHYMGINHAV